MTCHELAQRVKQLEPGASPQDVARICLLLANNHADIDLFADENRLKQACQQTSLKLQ